MRIYIEKLPSETVRMIREHMYSREELEKMHGIVKKKDAAKRKGFRRALLIAAAVLTILAFLSLPVGTPALFYAIGITGVMMLLVMLVIKLLMVDRMKRQFVAALQKGYPELEGEFGADSFFSDDPSDPAVPAHFDIGVSIMSIPHFDLPPLTSAFPL